MVRKTLHICVLLWAIGLSNVARAESQDEEYLGVSDPFGDPATYEFSDDEREDKEFFHLGRFLMIGGNVGGAIFTGGLGTTIAPAIGFGAKLVYFFDKQIGFEIAGGYSTHSDLIQPNQTQLIESTYDLINITGGFRYYFDTKSAPKAIAVANPYLALGGGVYIRRLTVIQAQGLTPALSSADSSQFGLYFGGGIEFPVYRGNIYLGLDARYHYIFFTQDGLEQISGDRSGGVFHPMLTITYSF